MSGADYKLFEVGGEYIVAQTGDEALKDHLDRIGNWQEWYQHDPIPDPIEVSLNTRGMFEQEHGYKEMTFGEFIGQDFVYTGPQLICWQE